MRFWRRKNYLMDPIYTFLSYPRNRCIYMLYTNIFIEIFFFWKSLYQYWKFVKINRNNIIRKINEIIKYSYMRNKLMKYKELLFLYNSHCEKWNKSFLRTRIFGILEIWFQFNSKVFLIFLIFSSYSIFKKQQISLIHYL